MLTLLEAVSIWYIKPRNSYIKMSVEATTRNHTAHSLRSANNIIRVRYIIIHANDIIGL